MVTDYATSVPGPCPWHQVTFGRQVSSATSGPGGSLRLSLFLMALTVLRTIGQVLCRMSLKSEFSWGGSPGRWRAIFIMSYQGCTLLACLRTAEADLDHLVGSYWPGFSTGKLLSPSFPHCTPGKQTTRHNPHLRGRDCVPLPCRVTTCINYLKCFCTGDGALLPH